MENNDRKMTREELLAKIKSNISTMDAEELVNYLDLLPKSDAYVVIRDCITQLQIKMLKVNSDNYQKYQAVKQEAKESWTHDHTNATMYDIDAALTRVYGLLLRFIKESNINAEREFIKLQSAINKIEERLGIEITDWSDHDDNEQGVKKDI